MPASSAAEWRPIHCPAPSFRDSTWQVPGTATQRPHKQSAEENPAGVQSLPALHSTYSRQNTDAHGTEGCITKLELHAEEKKFHKKAGQGLPHLNEEIE